MSIPFFDLTRQYREIGGEIEGAVRDVMAGGQFILGPQVAALERELAAYCGAAHGVGVASGTDALRLALEAAEVGPGAEVITSPFTFVATAEMISQLGAVPVFADIDPESYNLDPAHVAKKVTARTRAIIPVHLYGHPADMGALMEIAEDRGLCVIEDAAQAVGAEWRGRRVGSVGHFGCFSFFPTKNLGGYGDGGFVTTSDPALAERVTMLRQHGSRRKYFHERLGWSSRLDEIQAAVLRVKLRHLDRWTGQRRALAHRYDERLGGLPLRLPIERDGCRAVYHLYTVATPRRDDLQRHLRERGIPTAVHYPMPLHLQPLYREAHAESFPESERASREVLSLPLFPELAPGEADAVAAAVANFFHRS